MTSSFKKDQLVWLEADLSLGPALIVDDADVYRLKFLRDGEERNYTRKKPPLKRVQLFPQQSLELKDSKGQVFETRIKSVECQDGIFQILVEEGTFKESDIVSLIADVGVRELLQQSKFYPLKTFFLRRRGLELLKIRRSHPLQGSVGCRIELLPHQLFVVDRALQMNRESEVLRVLLADEVGLGKTIEAGMIFSALHAQEKLKKVLVLVPGALKVQWLTESFRRFNIRFRLDHEDLIEDSEFRDFVIASLDEIDSNTGDLDLLIVDEAHRLVHDPHRSDSLLRLVARTRHVLFLSATPQLHGPSEFFRMLKILGKRDEQPDVEPLVFQSKRSELGLKSFRRLEATFVASKEGWLHSFLADCLESRHSNPTHPPKKVFLIGSKAEDIVKLHVQLRTKFGEHFALFHENMDLVERDRQAAYFAEPEGAQFLLSSEIGGEGRNFQFCHDMVLLDLPTDPLVVEQRIGRLDRLGQTQEVRVWCPVLENSIEERHFEILRDRYRVFEEPWSGSGVVDLDDPSDLDKASEFLVRSRIHSFFEAGVNQLGFKMISYESTRGQELLREAKKLGNEPIREFLDQLYDLFGVEVEDFDSRGNWRVFASSLMFVDHFPGLGDTGERVLCFERSQAVAREDMTLFTLDHPDVIESIEFLLNSNHGKVAVTRLPEGLPPDIYLIGLPESAPLNRYLQIDLKVYSALQNKTLNWNPIFAEVQTSLHEKNLPDPILKAVVGLLDKWEEGPHLDALLLVVPEK